MARKGFLGRIHESIKTKLKSAKERMRQIKEEKEKEFGEAKITKETHKGKMFLELSPPSVAKSAAAAILVLALFYFFYEIRGILTIFFVSFLLAAAFDPLVDKLQEKKIPRAISVLGIYIISFFIIGIFLTEVFNLLVEQVHQIILSLEDLVAHFSENSNNIPFSKYVGPYVQELMSALDVREVAANYREAFSIVSNQLISLSVGLFNVLIILVLTFFMTVEEKTIDTFLLSLFPKKYGKYIITRMEAIKGNVGLWLRGQVMVSLTAAIISYAGLALLGIDYALTLSIIAGFCMVIPVMGRGVAWIITLPIVLNQDPLLAVWMSVYYLAVQQVENNFLVPYIMNKAVGLSPIIIIFAMMVGFQYLGILGLIISVPLATTVAIFVKDYASRKK